MGSLFNNKSAGMTGERRSRRRQRVLKGALASFNGGCGLLECVIRNQSTIGARITVENALGIPSRFELMRKGETPRLAKVRWRAGDTIGVSLA